MKKIILRIFIVCVVLGLVSGGIFLLGISDELKVQQYEIDTGGKVKNVRIAFLADLHSCTYGDSMNGLLSEVYKQEPDIVLLGGDIFDHLMPDKNAETVIAALSEKYPCFYVTGNHEFFGERNSFPAKMEILKKHGVRRLSGEYNTVSVNGCQINICGVDDPIGVKYTSTITESFEEQLENVSAAADNGNYTILLSHRPEKMELYAQYDFDLVLSGHAHGGQWRVPLLFNGLYAPDQGFFPKYAGGFYEENGTKMIVSRGLATKEIRSVQRVYNKPEVVIVDLK